MKLCLVGKDIQHSQSPAIYKRLLGNAIEYDLLDYEDPSQIPTAKELLKKYKGISITAPYKSIFIDQVEVSDELKKLRAINCIYMKDEEICGVNTDYLALEDILKNQHFPDSTNFHLLGDGHMSRVVNFILKKQNKQVFQYSRKSNNLNESAIMQNFRNEDIIINTCLRDYICTLDQIRPALYWDLNYNNELQSAIMKKSKINYLDGLDLLQKQAEYAIQFWTL